MKLERVIPLIEYRIGPVNLSRKKAQDRDGGEEIANNSVLKKGWRTHNPGNRPRLVRNLIRSGRTAELERLAFAAYAANNNLQDSSENDCVLHISVLWIPN
jgi:hypothetical protein